MIRFLAWAGFLGLLLLHLDFWRGDRAALVFGWLPEDMAYRLAWMVLATLYLFFFTTKVWREGQDS